MISILNTIPVEAAFMYKRQGYTDILQTGAPMADGSRLLPFITRPMTYIEGLVITGELITVCDSHTYQMGEMTTIVKGATVTVYRHINVESGLLVPSGYYYIKATGSYPQPQATIIYDAYIERLEALDATIEAEQCLVDGISDLAGGVIAIPMFKTEPFFMPSQTEIIKGSFNQSFNQSFDV